MSVLVDQPIGTVVSVSDREAVVRVASTVCPRCASGRGCGAGLVGPSKRNVTLTARIAEGERIAVGARVLLSLESTSLVRAALCLYGAPLAGLLLGSGLALLLLEAASDAAALLWGAAGLATGAVVGRVWSRRDPCISSATPTISAEPQGGVSSEPSL